MFNPTLAPFAAGLGVPGVSGTPIRPPGPRGLGDPYECLLDPFNPAPPIALCKNGLAPGENGEPDTLPDAALPFLERGEFEKLPLLAGDPLNGVGVLAYLGGVAYLVSGVTGVELGGSPRSFRWAGVRGMSERSSLPRNRGQQAATMLNAKMNCRRW